MSDLNLLFAIREIKMSPQDVEEWAISGDIYPYGWSTWWCRGKLYDEHDNSHANLMDAVVYSIIDEIKKEEKRKYP